MVSDRSEPSAARPRDDGEPTGFLHRRSIVAACLTAFLLAPVPLRAEISPGDLTLTVTPERNGNADPFSREMVLLRIHGVYRQAILLEEVIQPSLANFSWTQLGRDAWSKTRLPDGQVAIAFDRVVAIFPHHPGDFTIDPFIHRLTVNEGGKRVVVDVPSAPVNLPVATWTKPVGGPDAKEPWWLPAKDVTITDSWSPDPETVKLGETTRRIVTLEAQGLVAEGLPPRPVMRTRGILTFAGPVTRETLITPSGPVARATYQWDVRPAIDEVIPLDAIVIPWFDTVSRTLREAEIPARQIGGGLPDRDDEAKPIVPASPLLVVTAALGAFGLGLALIGVGTGRDVRRRRLDARTRRALRQAASARDARAFRAVLDPVLSGRPDLARAWQTQPEIAAGLAALDDSLYGQGPAAALDLPALDLPALARALARPVTVAPALAETRPRLAALDGRKAPSAAAPQARSATP
ncbi:BatD family protein [Methylobacterium sp. Leaf117]|uniref:BatD family protein n=1 Tax=Methylobacterium sp. Leaf117 TaxID=1736260 RepID=UPI0009E9A6A1|nr:BatD family protein [Methylobacterium sp. Leaf117]